MGSAFGCHAEIDRSRRYEDMVRRRLSVVRTDRPRSGAPAGIGGRVVRAGRSITQRGSLSRRTPSIRLRV